MTDEENYTPDLREMQAFYGIARGHLTGRNPADPEFDQEFLRFLSGEQAKSFEAGFNAGYNEGGRDSLMHAAESMRKTAEESLKAKPDRQVQEVFLTLARSLEILADQWKENIR